MWWHTRRNHISSFGRNGRVHLNRQGRQFSRLLAAEVCASAVVMLDTPRSEVVWRVLATHSIRQFPLHFPSRASPCAITFQLDSTCRWKHSAPVSLYFCLLTEMQCILNEVSFVATTCRVHCVYWFEELSEWRQKTSQIWSIQNTTESRPETNVVNNMIENVQKGNNFAIPTHKKIVGDIHIEFW